MNRQSTTVARGCRLLRQAIRERRPVTAMYDGLQRRMCPHVLGRTADGHWHVLVYQFDGRTRGRPLGSEGSPGNWRCIQVAGLSALRLVDGAWRSAANYAWQRQHCVLEVDVHV
ncbi:hypothetical protein [Tahibacter amnicola]|uniref:WYL domain-containing protein n=1 Tax=Tahibacter amnicola TaxID=2976241 RepID=A0ABY6BCZ3_9GAMM|nr:hypothetical protein [Tahibacter amnicola]UXI66491.1 hypothetical protein N4264_17275 [Tahibacter amnicola]